MRILLIANAGSVHIFNYVKNVLLPEKYDITILNKAVDCAINSHISNFYSNNGVEVISIGKTKSAFSFILRLYRVIRKVGYFDVVHCQSVVYIISIVILLTRRQFGKIVLSYWGSDLYRVSKIKQIPNYFLLQKANKITFITQEMKSYFEYVYCNKNIMSTKLQICDIADLFYDDIDNMRLIASKEELKRRMGLNPNKIVVTIGYTGRKQMQQYKAAKSIIEGSKLSLNAIQFIFPGYEMNNSTFMELNNYLEAKGVDYKIITGFMEMKDIPAFRLATDIFIHPQTTDALSNSVLEHLYAENVVINAAWLKYKVLDCNGVKYESFKTFEDLPAVFDNCVNNLEGFIPNCKNNRLIIKNSFSWKYWKPRWIELYQ